MTDTTRTSQISNEVDVKSSKKDPTVVNDQGFFAFDTGDTYDGSFEAKKKDRSVKMHGHGVYRTAEGDTYVGTWDSDKLGHNEEVTITFIDGSMYQGMFKDWCYSGKGKYVYPDGCMLECDFHENIPMHSLQLTDPNRHMWLGKAETGHGWLNPVNHYFDFLEKAKDVVKTKKRAKAVPVVSTVSRPTHLRGSPSKKSRVVIKEK